MTRPTGEVRSLDRKVEVRSLDRKVEVRSLDCDGEEWSTSTRVMTGRGVS